MALYHKVSNCTITINAFIMPTITKPHFKFAEKIFNPLSANVGYIRHDTVVTSDSCNSGHSENYKKTLTFSCKSLKFSKKWYTKLCILVDPFLRNTKSKIRTQKKALALKGLKGNISSVTNRLKANEKNLV